MKLLIAAIILSTIGTGIILYIFLSSIKYLQSYHSCKITKKERVDKTPTKYEYYFTVKLNRTDKRARVSSSVYSKYKEGDSFSVLST